MCFASLSSSLTIQDFIQMQGHHNQPTKSDESLDESLPSISQTVSSGTITNKGRKESVIPKLHL